MEAEGDRELARSEERGQDVVYPRQKGRGPSRIPFLNSPELDFSYLIFWTMALKASASLYAISARALRSRLMLFFLRRSMNTL